MEVLPLSTPWLSYLPYSVTSQGMDIDPIPWSLLLFDPILVIIASLPS